MQLKFQHHNSQVVLKASKGFIYYAIDKDKFDATCTNYNIVQSYGIQRLGL